jgi:hypothetical protein
MASSRGSLGFLRTTSSKASPESASNGMAVAACES